MLKFKIIEELKPNTELLELLENYNYTIKKGQIKHLTNTNLQFITPTEYLINYPTTLTIYEYKLFEFKNIKCTMIGQNYSKKHKNAQYFENIVHFLLNYLF